MQSVSTDEPTNSFTGINATVASACRVRYEAAMSPP